MYDLFLDKPLGAQVVADSWASPFNDDKKLIAFSDSVQDAAHRAGFFGARTYLNTVRTAIARGIDYLVDGCLPPHPGPLPEG
jgi:DEAD/DEAH box helicase domain-containing protein